MAACFCLFHGLAWCQLGCGEVVIHEDTWYAWLRAHRPLCGAEALDLRCVVDLGHDIAKRAGNLAVDGHVYRPAVCWEKFNTSS